VVEGEWLRVVVDSVVAETELRILGIFIDGGIRVDVVLCLRNR
jgi:hypothetical protein